MPGPAEELRQYYLTDEPDFIEGEVVEVITDDFNGYPKGSKGKIEIHWVEYDLDTDFNIYVLGVRFYLDGGFVWGATLNENLKTIVRCWN